MASRPASPMASPEKFDWAQAKIQIKKDGRLLEEYLKNFQQAGNEDNIESLDRRFLSDNQIRMHWYHKLWGVIGLCFCLTAIAKEREDIEAANGKSKPSKKTKTGTKPDSGREYDNNDPHHNDSESDSSARGDEQGSEDTEILSSNVEEEVSTIDTASLATTARKRGRESSSPLSSPVSKPHHFPAKAATQPPEGMIQGRKSWNDLIEDWKLEEQSEMVWNLASLPEVLVESLILGDLPSRMQDKNFSKIVDRFVKLRPTQGTYAVYLAFDSTSQGDSLDIAASSQHGMGMTPSDLMLLLTTMKKYINVDDTQSAELARKIDTEYRAGKNDKYLDYATERRYGGGGNSDDFESHDIFIKAWEDELSKEGVQNWSGPEKENDLNRHMDRCMPYVGLAANVLNRVTDHWSLHGRPSPLYGLIMATVKYLFGEKYSVRQFKYQVFQTVREGDIGLDEMVTTLLCSGHCWDGGLSYTWAGANKEPRKPDLIMLAQNADQLADDKLRLANIDESIRRITQSKINFDNATSEAVKKELGDYRRRMESDTEFAKNFEVDIEQKQKLVEFAADFALFAQAESVIDDDTSTGQHDE